MAKLSLIQGLKQSQKIALTPQLIKAIKFLELNNIELNNYLDEEILENPLIKKLENDDVNYLVEDNVSEDSNIGLSDNDSNLLQKSNEGSPTFETNNLYDSSYSSNENNNILEDTIPIEQSVYEIISEQVNIYITNKYEKLIAFALIEYVEPNGYLKVPIEELALDLNIESLKIEKVLSILKSFEPLGIFSQNLEEFLKTQLRMKNKLTTPMNILIDNLSKLVSGSISSLENDCGVERKEILSMVEIIKKCHSAPVDNIEDSSLNLSPPDIIVQREKKSWNVTLNEETLPKIIVLRSYWEELSKKKLSEDEKKYLASNFLAGKGIVKALEQRAATILKVANMIVEKQVNFLEEGIMHLHPMTLKDIAEELDIHESTVSRITNSKTIFTPRGTFDLKFFFSTALSSNSNLNGLSSKSVKEKIFQLINNEGSNILSDDKLSTILNEQGINVARRTVAKYREELTLPPSHQRKRLKRLAL